MQNLKRVLILSASYGEGHQQASNAIRDAFKIVYPKTDVRIIDFMKMTHPVLDSVAKYCYLKSIRYVPKLYGIFYRRTSSIAPTSLIQKRLNRLGILELLKYLEEYQPDVVISTFPTPAGVMSVLKESSLTQIPLVTVITDHAIHSQWIHPQTDLYFVGSDYVKQGMLKRGIPEHKVVVSGIPVREAFTFDYEPHEARGQLQLHPVLPTLLIMGGAYGVIGDISQICEELFSTPRNVQIVVICGRNEKLKQQIHAIAEHAVNPVHIYGFVEQVPAFMAAADLILTKAGGLTISESLAMELPMLLYRPIPGQEQHNAAYLLHSDVAVLANTKQEVIQYIDTLLIRKRMQLLKLRQNTRKIKRTHAAEEIVKHVTKFFHEKSENPQTLHILTTRG